VLPSLHPCQRGTEPTPLSPQSLSLTSMVPGHSLSPMGLSHFGVSSGFCFLYNQHCLWRVLPAQLHGKSHCGQGSATESPHYSDGSLRQEWPLGHQKSGHQGKDPLGDCAHPGPLQTPEFPESIGQSQPKAAWKTLQCIRSRLDGRAPGVRGAHQSLHPQNSAHPLRGHCECFPHWTGYPPVQTPSICS
jgi:hypothetical protein